MSAPGSFDMSDHLVSKPTQNRVDEADVEIHLQTPMEIKLEEGSVHRISSPTPFYIAGIKFWSAAPIHIYGPTSPRLEIKPGDDLGPGFSRGWHKLPDELKLKVLEFNLIYGGPLEYEYSFPGRHDIVEYGNLLRSTPEIAAMSREIYYTKNTFRVEIESYNRFDYNCHNRGQFLAFPNPMNNSLIRSLEFIITIEGLSSAALRRFIVGSYGFHDLRSLRIVLIGGIQERSMFRRLKKPFRFGCNGKVGVAKRLASEDTVELFQYIRPLFMFGCSKDKRGVVADARVDNVTGF